MAVDGQEHLYKNKVCIQAATSGFHHHRRRHHQPTSRANHFSNKIQKSVCIHAAVQVKDISLISVLTTIIINLNHII